MIKPQEIVKIFEKEFSPVLKKFSILEIPVFEIAECVDKYVWHPGCYVWWNGNDVIKVCRSLSNSRKRALEHLSADYGDKDKNKLFDDLKNNPESRLFLFNVKKLEDHHWVAAVEIFLETTLEPKIRSGRMG
ncbi:MAG: hypothetical protein ROO71_12740 [Balneola sp.]